MIGERPGRRRYDLTSHDPKLLPGRAWRCEECSSVLKADRNPVTCRACGGDMMLAPASWQPEATT